MKTKPLYTPEEARDFFSRLETYSAEYVKTMYPKLARHWPCKGRYKEWRGGAPIGHVLHFTAGANYGTALRHFLESGSASSNWLVAASRDRRMDETRKDLDLDKDLRADVMQVVPPWNPSWHAGWVNKFLTGTEVRNAGLLRPYRKGKKPGRLENADRGNFFLPRGSKPGDFDFYWWPEGYTRKFSGPVTATTTDLGVSFWESWTRDALSTVVTILRYLDALYPGKLRPEWLLAHHNVKRTKNDVRFPLDLVRNVRLSVLSSEHVDEIPWLAELGNAEDDFSMDDDPWILREIATRQADRGEEDVDGFDPERIEGPVDTKAEAIEAMDRLGYHVVNEDAFRASVRIYQQTRGLSVDGDAGSRTMGALTRELKGWGILNA